MFAFSRIDNAVWITDEFDALTTMLFPVSRTTLPLNGFNVSFAGINASFRTVTVTDALTNLTLAYCETADEFAMCRDSTIADTFTGLV